MQNIFKNKKVIIFDLDGTLIDSIGIWNDTDEILIKKLTNIEDLDFNISEVRDEILAKSHGNDIYLEYCEFLRKKFLLPFSAQEILKMRWDISDDFIKNKMDYKPQADKVLHFLKDKGFILALATNTTNIQMNAYQNYNRNIIDKADIKDMFAYILTKENVKRKKPDPEVHLKILDYFKVLPDECLVIEDSLLGVKAAINANIPVVAMYDKYADKDREEINKLTKYQFKNFEEMLNLLKKEVDF